MALSRKCEIIMPFKPAVCLPGSGPAHIENLFLLVIIQRRVQPVVSNMGAFGKGQSRFVSPPGADGSNVRIICGPGCDLQQNSFGGPGILVLLAHEKRQ